MLKKKSNLILLGIIFCALVLRLIGITHGFPFIFHPDEPTIVRSALGVRFNPNPGHFDWPHFYIYLNYFLFMAFAKFRDLLSVVGLKNSTSSLFPLIWNDDLIFYFLTRCFSAVLGALTVIPVYLSAKKLFGKKAGLFAGISLAFLPYHVWHSHYSLPDIPMVFLLSWGLYFSCLILSSKDLKNYLLSGFFIGLSASTKYNGGLTALMVPTAHFLRIMGTRRANVESVKKPGVIDFRGILALFLSGLSAFIAFIIGTPYSMLDFGTFFSAEWGKGAFWQFSNVGSVSFTQHVVKFLEDIFIRLRENMGYVVVVGYLITLGYLIYRIIKKKIDQDEYSLLFLFSISLFLVWYISGFESSRAHYFMIFYPFACIAFGYFISKIFSFLVLKNKLVSNSFLVLAFVPLVFFSLINSGTFYRGDTRNLLYKWAVLNIKDGETVVYNDKKVYDVFAYLNVNTYKGFDKLVDMDSVLIVLSDPENEQNLIESNTKYLKKLVSFNNSLRLGPVIDVYRYKNEEVVK